MGCGSSSTARSVPVNGEGHNFFPEPESRAAPAPTPAPKPVPATKPKPQTRESAPVKKTAPPSPQKPASPVKKKATYVPPTPITASVPEEKTPKKSKPKAKPMPSPVQDAGSIDLMDGDESLDADNFLMEAANNMEEMVDDHHHHHPDMDEDDEEDDFGQLVLNRDDFDPTVISAVTHDVQSTVPFKEYQSPTETPQPSSESGMRFDELYRLKGVLGTGAFSTVREGFHKSNQDASFAVKCINRKKLSEEDEAALLDEVAILKAMRHSHIIRLYDFFTEPSTYYLVMERMRGGELFDRIVAKAYYNEKEARDTCKIVLEAVGHCHKHHVAHRDLKPENLLLLSEDDDSAVKIADFGFAKRVSKPNSLTTQCGTPGYVAPEILEGTPYDERADMWSVGVILYILLGGYPPFIESTQRDLFRKIRKGEYEFHEEYWGTVSDEAKALISSLLQVDIPTRLTAVQALDNEWILGDDAKLANRDLGANLDKLRNFNGKRKFRAAVSTVMAVNKLNSLSTAFFSKPFNNN